MSLTSVDETRRLILERTQPLTTESVAIGAAAGRVLAENVHAAVSLPRFPSSAMDGYAVRGADLPAELPIVGRIAAGDPSSEPLPPRAAMGIATGGVVPEGADTVVPFENVLVSGDHVNVPSTESGANVRPIGGDIAEGSLVGRAGSVIGAARLAALAAAGIPAVACGRRPMVAIVSTGTELREPGVELGPGEIYESNGPMLEALLSAAGGVVRRLRPVSDDGDAHRTALADALGSADVVVTSGGVSVGPHDLVRPTLAALGVEEILWGVAMRPGKPFAFGVAPGKLAFGLPGNPVSSFVSATLFVVPALLALQGASSPGPHYLRGTLAIDARPRPEREDFVRALVSPAGELTPLGRQESHMIVAAADATALVRLPAQEATLPRGSEVDYLRLEPGIAGA